MKLGAMRELSIGQKFSGVVVSYVTARIHSICIT
jgi:hypothetical protein